MRLLFLFILLLNGLIYLWYTFYSQPATAAALPQVPDAPLLVLLTEDSPGVARQTIDTTPLTSVEPVVESPASDTQPASECYTLGPFMNEDTLNQATKGLMAVGRPFEKRASGKKELIGYWVMIPPLKTQAEADAIAKELKLLGDKHHYVVKDPDIGVNAVSLGVFKDRTNAERRNKEVTDFGYNPRLESRYRKDPVYWLDFTETAQSAPLDMAQFVGAQRLPRACQEIASQGAVP